MKLKYAWTWTWVTFMSIRYAALILPLGITIGVWCLPAYEWGQYGVTVLFGLALSAELFTSAAQGAAAVNRDARMDQAFADIEAYANGESSGIPTEGQGGTEGEGPGEGEAPVPAPA